MADGPRVPRINPLTVPMPPAGARSPQGQQAATTLAGLRGQAAAPGVPLLSSKNTTKQEAPNAFFGTVGSVLDAIWTDDITRVGVIGPMFAVAGKSWEWTMQNRNQLATYTMSAFPGGTRTLSWDEAAAIHPTRLGIAMGVQEVESPAAAYKAWREGQQAKIADWNKRMKAGDPTALLDNPGTLEMPVDRPPIYVPIGWDIANPEDEKWLFGNPENPSMPKSPQSSRANTESGLWSVPFEWFLDPLVVVGKGVKVARLGTTFLGADIVGASVRKTNSARAMRQIETELDDFLLYKETNGAQGAIRGAALDAVNIAKRRGSELKNERYAKNTPEWDRIEPILDMVEDERDAAIVFGALTGSRKYIGMLHDEHAAIADALTSLHRPNPYEMVGNNAIIGMPRPAILPDLLESNLSADGLLDDLIRKDVALAAALNLTAVVDSPIAQVAGRFNTGRFGQAWRAGKTERGTVPTLLGRRNPRGSALGPEERPAGTPFNADAALTDAMKVANDRLDAALGPQAWEGGPRLYHGSRTPMPDALFPDASGFNTTGLSSVARRYAGRDGEVVNVTWAGKEPPRILDGTLPASDRVKATAQSVISKIVPSNSYEDITADGATLFPRLAAATRPGSRSSTISVLRAAQQDLRAAGASIDETQRVLGKLRAAIKKDGYDALDHRVGNTPTTTFLNPRKLKPVKNPTAGVDLRSPQQIVDDEMMPLVRAFLPDRARTVGRNTDIPASPGVYESVYQLSKNFRKVAVWEWIQGHRGSGWLTVRGQDDGYATDEWRASLLESRALRSNRDFVNGLISRWQRGVSDTANLRRAAEIEQEATSQIVRHYFGVGATAEDGQLIEDIAVGMYRALQKKRMDALSTLQKNRGRVYAVDPDDGTLITAGPVMRSQLETKIPILDFRLMDKMVQELADPAMKPYLREIADMLIAQAGMDTVAVARRLGSFSEGTKYYLEAFNSAWKAAVLMRLGYTQRNVVEGWLRTWAVLGMVPALAPSNIASGFYRTFWRNPRSNTALGRIEGTQRELSKVIEQERAVSMTLEEDVARLLQRTIPEPDGLVVTARREGLLASGQPEWINGQLRQLYRVGEVTDLQTGASRVSEDIAGTTVGERVVARRWIRDNATVLRDRGIDPTESGLDVAMVLNAQYRAAGGTTEHADLIDELVERLVGANDFHVYDVAAVSQRSRNVDRVADQLPKTRANRRIKHQVDTLRYYQADALADGDTEAAGYWLSKREALLGIDAELIQQVGYANPAQGRLVAVMDWEDLPDFVYHVSPATTEIARSGYLRVSAGQGGGLGGGVAQGTVSATVSRATAIQLRDDMRLYASLRQGVASGNMEWPDVFEVLADDWMRHGGDMGQSEWIDFTQRFDDAIAQGLEPEATLSLIQGHYFDYRTRVTWTEYRDSGGAIRYRMTGPENPVILNEEQLAMISAEDINIIAIPRENIPRNAVIEDNGAGTGIYGRGGVGELGEIRIYADIPIGNRQLTDIKNRVIYDQMYVDTVRELDDVNARLDDFTGVMRRMGEEKQKLGKKYIGWDEAFGGLRGEVHRQNASNDVTMKNFFESKAARDAAIARLDDERWVDVAPDAPQYFDELSGDIIQFRNDRLGQIALGMRGPDDSVEAMLRWLDTDQGKAYSSSMGLFTDQQKMARATLMRRLVSGYLPTPEARALAARTGTPPTGAELRGVLGGRADLAPIHGREVKAVTTSEDLYHATINKIFKYLGTLPDSALVRQPFYNEVWKRETGDLYRKALAQGDDIMDEAVIARIEETAHRRALQMTEQTLYTITRYSNPAAALRFVSPFFSAWENSIRTWARIIVNDPSVAARAAILWDLPNRLGLVVDENGDPVRDGAGDFLNGSVNQYMVLPKAVADAIQEGLRGAANSDALKGTIFGDILGGAAEFPLKTPKGSMNVVAPGETPFLPGFGPVVTYSVGNILASKPDIQQYLKETLGEAVYSQIAPFGQASSSALDTVAPAGVRKAITGWQGESSEDYMRTLDAITVDAIVTWRLAGGDPADRPDPKELKDRADDFYKFSTLSSLTLPVSITRMSDYQPILNAWRKISSDPRYTYREAVSAFLDKYGDSYLMLTRSTSKSSINGLDPTMTMFQEMTEHRDLVAKLTARTIDDGGWGASIIAATIPNGEFNGGVYEYWRTQRQPGATTNYKSAMTPEEVMVEDNISRMWKEYQDEKVKRDTALAALGGIAWDSKASEAAGIKPLWEEFIDGMYAKYGNDFVQYGPNAYAPKLPQTLALIDESLNDETFMQSDLGQSPTWKAIREYMDERRRARNAIMQGADKDEVRAIFAQFTATHRFKTVQFSDFFDTYLENDDLTERMPGDGS